MLVLFSQGFNVCVPLDHSENSEARGMRDLVSHAKYFLIVRETHSDPSSVSQRVSETGLLFSYLDVVHAIDLMSVARSTS